MQTTINEGDTILLTLGNGLFREVTYDLLKSRFGYVKMYNQTKVGGVNRAIKLYNTTKQKGKFSNGTDATLEQLEKMRLKIIVKIEGLSDTEQAQLTKMEGA